MRVVAGEVDKDPALSICDLQGFKLIGQLLLLSLKSLNLLFLEVLLLKFILDGSEALVDVHAASGRLLELFLLRGRVFVFVLHAQFGHEDLDVEVVSDLLAIEEQLLHLDATLSELLLQAELLDFIFAHLHIAEIITGALLLTLFSLFLLLSLSSGRLFFGCDGLGVASSEVNSLLDERLHHEDVQVEFLTHHLRLLLLASEGITNQTDLGG